VLHVNRCFTHIYGTRAAYLDSLVSLLLSIHSELIGRLQTPGIEDVLEPHRLVHGIRQFPSGGMFRRSELKNIEPDFVW